LALHYSFSFRDNILAKNMMLRATLGIEFEDFEEFSRVGKCERGLQGRHGEL
jgi:hypothetical protein